MSAIIIENEILHYEVLGRGRPLIFIHGWVGSWRYWIPTMQATSISFRSYAIDLWGFGDSAKNISRYPIETQVNLLNSFMEEMGIGKVALVGHGLGAIVALNFAAKYPPFVDRVMAISLPLKREAIHTRFTTHSPVEIANWLLSDTPNTDATILETPKIDIQAISQSLSAIKNSSIFSTLETLPTPILMVHGQSDPAIVPPDPDLLSSLPEKNHYITLEEAGHYPMLDQQSKFNRLLADFLSLPSGESPKQLQLKEEWKRRVR